MLKATFRVLLTVMITFAVAKAQKPQTGQTQKPTIPFPKQGLYVKELKREAWDIWSDEVLREWKRRLPNREAFCQRLLLSREQQFFKKVLEFAQDEENDWGYREEALQILKRAPHVTLIEPLVSIAGQVPQRIRQDLSLADAFPPPTFLWRPQKAALKVLAVIADPRVPDILLTFAQGHPDPKMRGTKMEWNLQVEAFTKFAQLVGRWDWAWKAWTTSLLEEDEKENKKRREKFDALVSEARRWWAENKSKIKIRWEYGGVNIDELHPGIMIEEH